MTHPRLRLSQKLMPTIINAWPHVANTDTARQARPAFLGARGAELSVVCSTPEHCRAIREESDLLATTLRELVGPECHVQRIFPSVRPIKILVTGSPLYHDRKRLHEVMVETWYDATQSHGTEYTVIVDGIDRTPPALVAEAWAAEELRNSIDGLDDTEGTGVINGAYHQYMSEQGVNDPEECGRRLVSEGADLCLDFIGTESGEHSPWAVRAAEAGIPVRTVRS